MVRAEFKKQLNAHGGEMTLDVRLSIEQGLFVTLYGKSGAGKTTILRMIAGLMSPEEGVLEVDKVLWADSKHRLHVKPQKRSVGFVFQDYALFPNMTVLENLTYALPKGTAPSSLDPIIEMVELGDLRHAKPATLSGGQQQRVALARAIVPRPKLLLLDEPLSALDWEIREKLQGYILQLHDEYKLTSIMVSHDPAEVLRLSDYVYVLERGVVVKEGAPLETLVGKAEASTYLDRIGEIVKMDTDYVTVMIDHRLHQLPLEGLSTSNLKVGAKVNLSPASSAITLKAVN